MIGIFVESKKLYPSYIFKTFFDILGYPYKVINNISFKSNYDLLFYYGNNPQKINFRGKVINIPEGNTKKTNEIYDKKNNSFKFDIIKESLEILSRKEEYNGKKDHHDRFIAENSSIYSEMAKPRLNKYLRVFEEIIEKHYKKQEQPLIKKVIWPGNKPFAVCLSHDVDAPYKYNFIGSLIIIKKSLNLLLELKFFKFVNEFGKAFFCFFKKDDPYWQFNNIINLEKRYGFKSTFFFSINKKHKLDPNYSLSDSKIIKVIKAIHNSGWEIGLHLSYNSYENKQHMLEEKKLLEKIIKNKIVGTRTHFLRFNTPNTWNSENYIFQYDTSLGYPDCIGYRNGLCYPYKPFDIVKDKELNIVEIPLNVMDGALSGKSKTLPKNCWKNLLNFYKSVKKMNGTLTLDWHQRYFFENDFPGFKEIYKKSLDFFKKENAFVGSCKQMNDWWDERNEVSFIKTEKEHRTTTWTLTSKYKINNLCFSISAVDKRCKLYTSKNASFKMIKRKSNILLKFKQFPSKKNVIIKLTY